MKTKQEKMKWSLLKCQSCPKCAKTLTAYALEGLYKCDTENCGFMITRERYAYLTRKMREQADDRDKLMAGYGPV